jgi:hypothetical protein
MHSVVGAENGKVVQCWRSVVVFLVYTHHHPKICTNFAHSLKTLPFAFGSANFRIQDLRKRESHVHCGSCRLSAGLFS